MGRNARSHSHRWASVEVSAGVILIATLALPAQVRQAPRPRHSRYPRHATAFRRIPGLQNAVG